MSLDELIRKEELARERVEEEIAAMDFVRGAWRELNRKFNP